MADDTTSGRPQLELPRRQEWGLRPERKPGASWFLGLGALLMVVIALQIFSLLRAPFESSAGPGPKGAAPGDGGLAVSPRDLAARLQRNNLHAGAAEVLEDYLRTLPADRIAERRKTLVTIGDLLMKAGRHEEAIVRYFRAESLNPDRDTRLYIGRQITACMEKLGKFDELAYELADRTQPLAGATGSERPGEEAAGRVVARIGVQTITASDLDAIVSEQVDRQLASVPGLSEEDRLAYRKRLLGELQSPQRRLQLLRDHVARKVLYREGTERELDRSKTVLDELRRAREALVANQVLREAMEKVRVSEGDLEIFFEARKEHYIQPARAWIRLALLDSESAAREAIGSIDSEDAFAGLATEKSTHAPSRPAGGELGQPVTEDGTVPALGLEPALTRAIFAAPEREHRVGPVKVQGGWAIAWVQRREPRRTPTFEEVKDRVGEDYSQRKQLEVQQELLERLFKKYAVNIHTEAFLETGEAADDPDSATAPAAPDGSAGGAAPGNRDSTPERP